MNIDLQAHPMTVTLGTLTLTVTAYQLKMNVPVLRHTLCNGALDQTLLPESPCTLMLSGTILRESAAEITAALETALAAHTAFSFTFQEIAFSGMQLTALETAVTENAKTAAFQITMTGVTGT